MTTASRGASEEIDFGRTAKETLYAMIAQDKEPKVIRIQAQLVQSFRDEISSEPAETPIDFAEQILLQFIREHRDAKEIKLQAQTVCDLEKFASLQTSATVNTQKAQRGGQGKVNIENRRPKGQEKTRNADTKAADNQNRTNTFFTPASDRIPLSPIRGGPRPANVPPQLSKSPARAARKRQRSPQSPTQYLSDASSYNSPRKPQSYLGPPRPTVKVKKFDSKEDKWSRHVMHPASAPRAQLPKLIRAGKDLEKMLQVSAVHESYDTGITKATQRHVRKLNRTNGICPPDMGVKRDVWAMLGARPDGTRLQPREEEGERVEETGLTAGNLRRLEEATRGEEHRTFAEVDEGQFERDDAHANDEEFPFDAEDDFEMFD